MLRIVNVLNPMTGQQNVELQSNMMLKSSFGKISSMLENYLDENSIRQRKRVLEIRSYCTTTY